MGNTARENAPTAACKRALRVTAEHVKPPGTCEPFISEEVRSKTLIGCGQRLS